MLFRLRDIRCVGRIHAFKVKSASASVSNASRILKHKNQLQVSDASALDRQIGQKMESLSTYFEVCCKRNR
jgi:hypothetical protein